jgi:hypothetical protein
MVDGVSEKSRVLRFLGTNISWAVAAGDHNPDGVPCIHRKTMVWLAETQMISRNQELDAALNRPHRRSCQLSKIRQEKLTDNIPLQYTDTYLNKKVKFLPEIYANKFENIKL